LFWGFIARQAGLNIASQFSAEEIAKMAPEMQKKLGLKAPEVQSTQEGSQEE